MNKIDSILEKVPSDVSINVMLDSMDVSESALAKAGQVEAARDKADTPSDMLSQGPQSARSETDSPRPVPIVDRARRNHILRVIKRSIPIVAKERRDLIRKNAEYSRLCILDAFQGRLSNGLANNSKKSKWIYTIFCIQTSDWMFNSIVIASALHTISIFLEPENTCPNSILFRLFQMIIVLIYAVDVGLKMGYEGVHVSHSVPSISINILYFNILYFILLLLQSYPT
ncbi:hypothetical protein EON65_05230 [archaeon]|nr:MAG: hypothetical protein EON65_05230 [archaeon]